MTLKKPSILYPITILSKLKHLGLDQHSVYWFQSYLQNRTQRTIINNTISSEQNTTYSVPQGSILGLTLFTIYMNDLAELVSGNINFYADDTILYSSDSKLQKVTVDENKSNEQKSVDVTLTLGNTSLENVKEYTYLAVTIDSHLTFQSYGESMINRINLKISYLRKIRKYMTIDSALLLYKGTILPILEYADFVYDIDIKYINKRLQTIQNTGLYIVFNQHIETYDLKDSTEAIHRRAGLYRLKHRRKMHMISFIYNYIENQDLLDVRDIKTRRRDGILFAIDIIENYKARQDPMYRAVMAWNTLPVHIRNAETKIQLCGMLKNSIPNPYSKID